MATDFSISTLLDLPSQESRNNSRERKEMESPISGSRFSTPIHQLQSDGKSSSIRESSYSREPQKPSIDLTRFPAADFTTIVIPKRHTKPRRKRTAFSNIQLHFLEQFFQKKAYPSSQERNFIGSILNIGSGQVKTWYQNRRTKMKKNKVFDFGFQNGATVGGGVDSNGHCIDFEKNNAAQTSPLASSHTRTADMFDMHCGNHQPPTWVGSNLVLMQQQSMVGQHR